MMVDCFLTTEFLPERTARRLGRLKPFGMFFDDRGIRMECFRFDPDTEFQPGSTDFIAEFFHLAAECFILMFLPAAEHVKPSGIDHKDFAPCLFRSSQLSTQTGVHPV